MTSTSPFRRLPDGSWVDAGTGEVIATGLPQRLHSVVTAALFACVDLDGSHAEQINASRRKRAERMLEPLQREIGELVARIDHGWAWLDRHQDHAQFAEREDHVLTWIGQYEALERARQAARRVLA